jgi:hypothetical protein
MRGEEGLFGSSEITAPQPDVAEFNERPAKLATHPRPQLVARAQRFGLSDVAWTRNPENFGAVHAASSADGADR